VAIEGRKLLAHARLGGLRALGFVFESLDLLFSLVFAHGIDLLDFCRQFFPFPASGAQLFIVDLVPLAAGLLLIDLARGKRIPC
jgi:hypothetical protein